MRNQSINITFGSNYWKKLFDRKHGLILCRICTQNVFTNGINDCVKYNDNKENNRFTQNSYLIRNETHSSAYHFNYWPKSWSLFMSQLRLNWYDFELSPDSEQFWHSMKNWLSIVCFEAMFDCNWMAFKWI